MKFLTAIIGLVALLIWYPKEQKKYTVTMTLNEWLYYSNGFRYTAEKLRQSDLPSKDVALITDSVFAPFLNIVSVQITQQQEAEKKNKPDSTGKKK